MEKRSEIFDVAIVGCGPRGLSALESLFFKAISQNVKPNVLLVETTEYPGAGLVYSLKQPDSNWLNVSTRTLGIPPREQIKFEEFIIPAFDDFQTWSGYAKKELHETATDEFPLRSQVGRYLYERFQSIANILFEQGLLTFIESEVDHIDIKTNEVWLRIIGGTCFKSKELALCIGHQPIAFDEQLKSWLKGTKSSNVCELFTQPYPIPDIKPIIEKSNTKIVAIRGFGLAMIDVMRGLTTECGGAFKIINKSTRRMKYIASGNEPKMIVPFSLDGLPLTPKPLNHKIDKWFIPSHSQRNAYEESINHSITNKKLTSIQFLLDAISPIIVDRFMALNDRSIEHSLSFNEIEALIFAWSKDEDFEHELIISKKLNAITMLRKYVDMANGTGVISLDYCIGQVWRHCQPTMYKLLSFAPISDDLIAKIVQFDERLKRYSYGPPIDSLQQMITLIECGIVNLDFVKDPKISLHTKEWKLINEDNTCCSDIMINSVLDAPEIVKVVSPIIKSLLSNPLVEPLHDNLGVRTHKDGMIENLDKNVNIPIAVMGRLAKGTLIGVDAIAECFGSRSHSWAEGLIGRMKNY